MRFVQFEKNGRPRIGVSVPSSSSDEIVDIASFDPVIPTTMKEFIEEGESVILKAERAVLSGQHRMPKTLVKLLPPIHNPDKVMCVGLNYEEHCMQHNIPVPKEPVIFGKFSSTIIGAEDDIPFPGETTQLDWEGELAIVVGKVGKRIPIEKAMDHVFGYTVALDVTARDWIHRNGKQVLIAKSMDAFCPLGPALVTKEHFTDPTALAMSTKVNGVTKQSSNTSKMIFKPDLLIAYISRFFTLQPGDVILTGSPPGTGFSREPPEFLKSGDVVEVEIETIGSTKNRIV